MATVRVYTPLVRPLLFALDAERAHELTLSALSSPLAAVLRLRGGPAPDPRLGQLVCGLAFANPLGLAAGLDKQATAISAWGTLGFGCVEIGTVTPRPQPGNPKPRLFRLREDAAIINRFGFNSDGAAAIAPRLARPHPASLRVGVNIGKNKETSNERAADDYRRNVDLLHDGADYFVVNVSSPNTAQLRDLQESRALRALVEAVVQQVRAAAPARAIPVFVKVAPDLSTGDLLATADAAMAGGASGIVATNTTTSRSGLRTTGALAQEAGGLSGAPLRAAAHTVCRSLFRHFGPRVPIIGVGGIGSADDAYLRLRAGASLLQIYTALIYEGPGVVGRILTGISERLHRDGASHLSEVIGIDATD